MWLRKRKRRCPRRIKEKQKKPSLPQKRGKVLSTPQSEEGNCRSRGREKDRRRAKERREERARPFLRLRGGGKEFRGKQEIKKSSLKTFSSPKRMRLRTPRSRRGKAFVWGKISAGKKKNFSKGGGGRGGTAS